MQKLIIPCAKLTLAMLLFFPSSISAQTDSQAQMAHQQAEKLLLQQYPQAQKVDLAKLTASQQNQHKKCNTCGQKTVATTNAAKQPNNSKSLAQLQSEQEILISTIKNMQGSNAIDKALIDKYKRALQINVQQTKLAENAAAAQNKLELQNKKTNSSK